MKSIAFLALSIGLIVGGSSLAEERSPVYELDRSPPQVVKLLGKSAVVQFGPVRLTVPEGWKFKPFEDSTAGVRADGTTIFILPARLSTSARQQQFSPLSDLPRARRLLSEHVSEMCAKPMKSADLDKSPSRAVIAGYCSISKHRPTEYAIQYDIYFPSGSAQIHASGEGDVMQARQALDAIVLSASWSDGI